MLLVISLFRCCYSSVWLPLSDTSTFASGTWMSSSIPACLRGLADLIYSILFCRANNSASESPSLSTKLSKVTCTCSMYLWYWFWYTFNRIYEYLFGSIGVYLLCLSLMISSVNSSTLLCSLSLLS